MDITETLKCANRDEWRQWLETFHQHKSEIWLLSHKKNKSISVSYLDAVEEALCFGWVDGLSKTFSELELARRFTPRRPKSNWTELNKARARRLITLGKMTDSGFAVLPDLDAPFEVADYVRQAIKGANATEQFESLPELYIKVRVGYIDEMKKNGAELAKRLNNFVEKTAQGKRFGNWNDNGRLTD